MSSGVSSAQAKPKPHAVCIPCPFQSHITALLSLAKLLHHRGFHITFVNTEFNHNRLLQSNGPNSLDGLPDFRFETIPDGLPSSDARQDQIAVVRAIDSNLLSPFMELMTQNLLNTRDVPPATCILADIVLSFSFEAGEQLGLPVVSYCTISACALMAVHRFPILKQKGLYPINDTNCMYLDTVVDCIPGMNNMRLRDFTDFLGCTDQDDDFLLTFSIDVVEKSSKRASALIMNTFDALEENVLKALSPSFPPLYTIGPIHLLQNEVPKQNPINSIESNLWEEETECLNWLDSKKPNSVVYVNFGSLAVMSADQLHEFAWGLVDSNCSFFWVVRPDLVRGSASANLGPEFEEATGDRCFIAKWCPQVQVLDHPSVGLFLTHSGWNSTLESMSSGVPILCWPYLGDQLLNCRYSCTEWGIGKQIERDANRDSVRRLVNEVLGGEEGKRMKDRVMEWRNLAHAAVAPNGSSSLNLERVVKKLVTDVGK